MKLKESVIIHAPPEKVWQYLANLDEMAKWNTRVQSWHPLGIDHAFGVGYRFRITYKLTKKSQSCDSVVRTFDSPKTFVLFHTDSVLDPDRKTPMTAEERYDLTVLPDGKTAVHLVVTIQDEKTPFWARILVWIVMRIGKPKGAGPLDHLKKKVENF